MAALLTAMAFHAPAAKADVEWLCEPGMQDDPCEIPLDTTLQGPGGDKVVTPKRVAEDKRPVDCFYVYPTVSNQPGLNATKARDPEIVSIAKFQASRFSQDCRVFAPLYRQIPLSGLAAFGMSGPGSPGEIAYSDVLEAWRDYLKNDNDGRGVVLIGHSQGSIMLRHLISTEVEKHPAQEKLLAGALLMGGNVTVKEGETTGGDFADTPICTKKGQFGCVVAYSTYSTDPGAASFFGNTNTDFTAGTFSSPHGSGYAVACTDPAVLSGENSPVGVTIPSEPFAPGPINAGIIVTNGGPPPTAATTWVTPPSRFTGACKSINGANVYRYDPTDGSQRPNEFPPSWGTHLLDVNLGYDRLVDIARMQASGWLGARFSVGKPKLNKRKGTAKLPVTVPGAGKVRVTGAGFKSGGKTLTKPATTKLKIRARGKAKHGLHAHGKAPLKAKVTYIPAVGEKSTITKKVKLRLKRADHPKG
jgi:alpha-beta hydrolase superfamily lysophospholipase